MGIDVSVAQSDGWHVYPKGPDLYARDINLILQHLIVFHVPCKKPLSFGTSALLCLVVSSSDVVFPLTACRKSWEPELGFWTPHLGT